VSVRVLGADQLGGVVALLAAGRVVAIPTDTVYGLASQLDAPAVDRLFAAKRRPASMPVAVLCASADDARRIAAQWPPAAERLATRYWPGPLTVVVGADRVLAALLGSAHSVGLRVPDDALCRELLERVGPLAVTSANRHGEAPATTPGAVVAAFGAEDVEAVLDGGERDGEVSTVVDLTANAPSVVRHGALDADAVLATARGA